MSCTLPAIFDSLETRRMPLFDVGARGGIPPHWLPAGRFLKVIAFEPDQQEAERLRNAVVTAGAEIRIRPEALWEEQGRRLLFIARTPGNSSLFPPCQSLIGEFPNPERFDVVSQVEVETTTIDEVAASEACVPLFAKIDAQGAALPILRGARKALNVLIGLEVEVEMVSIYEGEPLFGDVDAYLRGCGFELVDLRPTYWRREVSRKAECTLGQLIFCDALYMLSPTRLSGRLAAMAPEDAAHTFLAALLCCAIYGLDDWAIAYEEAARKANLASPGNWASDRVRSNPVSWLPFRHPLGLVLKDLGDRMLLSRDSWAHAEQRIAGKPRSRHLSRWR